MSDVRPWTVHTGDCRVSLGGMDEESVDAIVTDTPYGLSTLLDPWNLDREALWQKLTAGKAELPIKTLMRAWLDTGENPVMKGRGFMGKEWDALVPPPNTWLAAWRVLKPGAVLMAFGGTRTYDLITMAIRFAGFEVDDQICTWLQGQGMAKRVRLSLKIDERCESLADKRARRALAKKLKTSIPPVEHPHGRPFKGHDRALGPKWEPIIVARKPCRGTIAATALRYGTGGFNVDGCRIPRETIPAFNGGERSGRTGGGIMGPACPRGPTPENNRGGYPANVVVDERVAQVLDAQSGQMRDGVAVKRNTEVGKVTGRTFQFGNTGIDRTFGGGGGASRFFYTAKASTSERDKGLEDLPAMTAGEKTGREDDTAGVSPYAGARADGGRNPHPTVKPISLMRWLVRLASPPGAWDPDISKRPVVVDMFAGSGSTLVAGLAEGVRVVGCEMDPQMADVSRRRCQNAYALPREESGIERAEDAALPKGQSSLF